MTDEVTRSDVRVATASAYLAVGTHIGGYRIESYIDRGGMAFVYEAVDLRLNRNIALKVLAPQRTGGLEFRERFLRESRFAASLDHPNVVPIYEAGEAAGLLYIAMRYVRGSNLEVVLGNHGPLELERVLAILTPVADALDTAHASGLVHRDVKPANILLAFPGERDGHEQVYLSDFGVTKLRSGLSKLTVTGNIIGTLAYTAPEQIRGEPVDARADLYAFGCVAYECLTGFSPFMRLDQAGLLWAHLNEQPAAVSVHRRELSAADPIIARALAKDPSDRFRSCGEFMAALSAALLTCGRRVPNLSTEGSSDPASESVEPVGDAVPGSGRGLAVREHGPANATTVAEGVVGGPSPFNPSRGAVSPRGVPATRNRTGRRAAVIAAVVVVVAVVAALVVATTSPAYPAESVAPTIAMSSSPAVSTAAEGAPNDEAGAGGGVSAGSAQEQPSISTTDPGPASLSSVEPDSAVAIPAVDGSPIGVGQTPGQVAITPDGRYAYIANGNAGVVTVVDVAIGRVTATIPIAAGPPRYIAFAPDGSEAYVSVYDDEKTISLVAVLDTQTTRVLRTIPVDKTPYALAVTPDQKFVYVPSHDHAVDVISVASNMVVGMVDVPPNPHSVSFAPDGKTAYVANHDSNVVSVLDTSSNKFVKAISVGTGPHSLTVSPDGKQVAVVCVDSNDVYFIDSATNKVTGTVTVGTNPQDVAYTPDGRFLYTANVESNTVSVVDVESQMVTAEIPTKSPTSIAFLRNGRNAYVTNLNADTLTVLSTS